MKKRLALLVMCVFSLTIILSGCNLFVQDNNKYLQQKVATVEYEDGSMLTITKEELIRAYNNYGSNLMEGGQTQEQALSYLVDFLINKEIMLKEVQYQINENNIKLKNEDYNEMWTNTYEAVIANLSEYEKQIIEDLSLVEPPILDETTETEPTTFKKFQPKATIEKVEVAQGQYEWKIKSTEEANKPDVDLIYSQKGSEVESIATAVQNKIGENEVLKKAYKKYLQTLKDYEKDKGLSTNESDIFKREIERIYTISKENKYLSLYLDSYQNQTGYSPISVNDVLEYIQEKMVASYLEYSIDNSAYESDILESREEAWYIMDNEYFYVTHILVKYTEEQETALDDLEKALKQGKITQAEYDAAKENIFNNLVVTANGEETELTIEQLHQNLANALQNKTDAEKVDIINEYVYKYNQDTGNINKTFDYVIGTEESKMVESFTDASRELFDNGNGQFGAISEPIESEYGAHIVIYLNPVTNAFTINGNLEDFKLVSNNQTILEQNITKITNFKLSQLNTQTLFDYAYEKILTDNTSLFETLHTKTLREGLTIKLYKDNYKL